MILTSQGQLLGLWVEQTVVQGLVLEFPQALFIEEGMGLKPFHQVSLLLGSQHLFLRIIVSISFNVLLLAGFSSSWLA